MKKWFKIDLILIFLLTLGYAFFSFSKLGSIKNPNTFTEEREIILKVDGNLFSKIRYFTGHYFDQMEIYTSLDNQNYELLENAQNKMVFTWNDIELEGTFNYIKFILKGDTSLGEVSVYDTRNQLVSLKDFKNGHDLIDEQSVVPKEISYYNSAYFDEIYFARTAYEYANGLPAYEWVHPSLAKLISAIPIKLFGMAPFYYRFMGNLAACLMIPILYLFAKKMFKSTKFAFLTACLLIFDNFHFAQGRIGTTDSILALFILTSYYFMYLYVSADEKISWKRKVIYLFASGLFFGCSVSTKWTGLFAGLGLCILFFLHFFKHYWKDKRIVKEGMKIIGVCTIFFVLIPLFIYLACYFLFPNLYYFQLHKLSDLLDMTGKMYHYHSTLTDPHPFYSNWYSWLFMYKPVWYYQQTMGDLVGTISGIGNPIIWWCGTIGLFYLLYLWILKKDKNAGFIVVGYICFLLPYMKIDRGMFLYHYYPCFIFSLFGITYIIKRLDQKIKWIYPLFITLIIFFFVYFYPAVSGELTSKERINDLKWLSSWTF